jgi:hypothetical protein
MTNENVMPLRANDPATWLETVWQAIWDWEDSEPMPERIDDVKTAMAWITEAMQLNVMD